MLKWLFARVISFISQPKWYRVLVQLGLYCGLALIFWTHISCRFCGITSELDLGASSKNISSRREYFFINQQFGAYKKVHNFNFPQNLCPPPSTLDDSGNSFPGMSLQTVTWSSLSLQNVPRDSSKTCLPAQLLTTNCHSTPHQTSCSSLYRCSFSELII